MSRAPRSSRRRRSDWVDVAAPAARRWSTVTPRAPRASEATRISPAERGPASSVRQCNHPSSGILQRHCVAVFRCHPVSVFHCACPERRRPGLYACATLRWLGLVWLAALVAETCSARRGGAEATKTRLSARLKSPARVAA